MLQLDGSIPNLALMRLASHHRTAGDEVELRHVSRPDAVERRLGDEWDRVYASLIFKKSRPVAERLKAIYPAAIIGGTGWDFSVTLEGIGIPEGSAVDYSDYPAWKASMGFTQRGCRLKCGFCVVPQKEGNAREVASIWDIWRGDPWPRNILLLDNDPFGVPSWRKRIEELKAGKFKVCWNQGFNVRLIGDEEAAAIAETNYQSNDFKRPRLYTAWDNRKDEDRLFTNLASLVKYGVRPDNIFVYMLIGFWAGETDADWLYRAEKLLSHGFRPYPMPYVRNDLTRGFQRWLTRRGSFKATWAEYKAVNCRPERLKASRMELPLWSEMA